MMRRRQFLGYLAAVSSSISTRAREVRPVRIYLLAGQSNMAGRGNAAELPPDLKKPRPDIPFYYQCGFGSDRMPPHCSRGWIALQPCPKHPSTTGPHFGPEITFGAGIAARHRDRRIALIKMGRGSTFLASDWLPDLTSGRRLYPALLDLVRNATSVYRAAGTKFEIAGMAWMQGEADSTSEPFAKAYASNLRNFVSRLRQDLKLPTLPFVVGLTGRPTRKMVYAELVRSAQRKVAAETYNALVDADDLPRLADATHLDSRAQIEMGKRLAKAMAAMVQEYEK